MNYLSFISCPQDEMKKNNLRELFLRASTALDLNKIIRTRKWKIQMSFHKAVDLENVYLIMVKCNYDPLLIKLARKYNFPRGFPVLWDKANSLIQYFGFYPKFSNDERQLTDNLNEFESVNSLSFSKKWSGFLGQLLAFQINDRKYWTVTSKNSANSSFTFITDAHRLFEPFITENLINDMIEHNLHICAEMISMQDQTHGSRVLNETAVVTAVGSGHRFSEGAVIPLKSNQTMTPFVNFMNGPQRIDFCVKHSLPCDSIITITGDSAKNFMKKLSEYRDFMSDSKLNSIIEEFDPNSITIISGTITHSNILVDCLEGLVIIFCYADRTIVKKYKFAPYTIRTMLLRPIFEKFLITPELEVHTKSYVNFWCVTEEGRRYWYRFAMAAYALAMNIPEPDPKVGIHIQIANTLSNNQNVLNEYAEKFKSLELAPMITLIICIGPIGSGKTTIANLLAKIIPKSVVIDGDDLGLGTQITSILGKTRNEFSRWRIIEAVLQGLVPIISTGGGVLCNQQKKPIVLIKKQLEKTLGLMCKLIVCLQGEFGKVTQLSSHEDYDMTKIYSDAICVKKSIVERISRGEWNLDPKFKSADTFVDYIAKLSQENMKFANALVKDADFVFGIPRISSENYGIESGFNLSDVQLLIINSVNSDKQISGKFGQIRILCLIDNTISGHITWLFDMKNNISYSKKDFDALAAMYDTEIKGHIFQVKSTDNTKTYVFAVPEKAIHEDHSTHITIDSGNHAPKETGTIVLAILNNDQKITLTTKDGKQIEYDLSTAAKTSCLIRVLGAFGI